MPISIPGFYEPFSSLTHLISAAVFFVASICTIYKVRGNSLRVTAVSIYCVSVLFLLAMSGTYHLLDKFTIARDVLRRLDHAGIWAVILGTFTPIHIILFERFWRWGILAMIWTTGITGMVLEVIFIKEIPEILIHGFFLTLGWMGVVTFYGCRKLRSDLNLKSLVYGGLFYTVGAVIDAIGWPKPWVGILEAHEIFHIFVILGIYCHWSFIYKVSGLPFSPQMAYALHREAGMT